MLNPKIYQTNGINIVFIDIFYDGGAYQPVYFCRPPKFHDPHLESSRTYQEDEELQPLLMVMSGYIYLDEISRLSWVHICMHNCFIIILPLDFTSPLKYFHHFQVNFHNPRGRVYDHITNFYLVSPFSYRSLVLDWGLKIISSIYPHSFKSYHFHYECKGHF